MYVFLFIRFLFFADNTAFRAGFIRSKGILKIPKDPVHILQVLTFFRAYATGYRAYATGS